MYFQRIVIKLGTSSLTAGSSHISPSQLVELARQVSKLHTQKCEIIIVTSGAMAAGRERLSFPKLPKELPAKQMLAAVGQPHLMALYERVFSLYNLAIAQVLLTRSDLSNRQRYLNSRNTLNALLRHGVIPIINENDSVATEEIRVGDNDNLSALVANLIDADLLALLTDQAGLYTADPRRNPSAQLISEVKGPDIPKALWQAAGGSGTQLGTGGMVTKLQAADLARRSGTVVIITTDREPDVLLRLANGEPVGTYFHPLEAVTESRKRYILSAGNAPGLLRIDEGAVQALRRGGSLLPVGVCSAEGEFEPGDTVRIYNHGEREIARGITNYCTTDLQRIIGRKSDEIEDILGYYAGDEVIHHNDLVLL